MIPDVTTSEGRKALREACERTMRLARQRGSSVAAGSWTCTQHPYDVIEDVKIMLAVLDELDRVEAKLIVIADERDTALSQIGVLYREVNQLRGQLGWGRKYVQWDGAKATE